MNAYVFMAQPLVDRAPAFCLTIFGSDNKFSSEDVSDVVVVQDVIHIGTKLKTRLLNSKIKMHMGKYTVDLEHLKSLIEHIPKDQHLLCISFLNSKFRRK